MISWRRNFARAAQSRDILCDALIATKRVETLKPDGALYAFLKIDGITDTRAAAFDIVDKVGVGLAPGTAFGAGGELFLRACFPARPGTDSRCGRQTCRITSCGNPPDGFSFFLRNDNVERFPAQDGNAPRR